jgi:hypothetical protein
MAKIGEILVVLKGPEKYIPSAQQDLMMGLWPGPLRGPRIMNKLWKIDEIGFYSGFYSIWGRTPVDLRHPKIPGLANISRPQVPFGPSPGPSAGCLCSAGSCRAFRGLTRLVVPSQPGPCPQPSVEALLHSLSLSLGSSLAQLHGAISYRAFRGATWLAAPGPRPACVEP